MLVDGQCVISGTRPTPHFILGGYSYPLLGSIQMAANRPVDIVVEFSTPFSPLDAIMGKHLHLGWETEQLIPAATATAKQADVAVVIANQASGEGMDRDTFSLPGDQDRLIQALCAANPNTVVVLNTPGAVLMPWLDQAAAVLQEWYPGEAVGTALASILFGESEPAGRLPITFPAAEDQAIPAYTGGGSVDFAEDVFVGYRYYGQQGYQPLFPFGYGLSYTQFEYTDLQITPLDDLLNVASVRVTVRNTGQRTGSDVVQVYIGKLPAPVPTPGRQLAGFARVTLNPRESTTVELPIPRRILSYWDDSARSWVTPGGTVPIYVGSTSADDRLTGALTIVST